MTRYLINTVRHFDTLSYKVEVLKRPQNLKKSSSCFWQAVFPAQILNFWSQFGTIQVLSQHALDIFRPTHQPYQQTSAFPYTHFKHDVSISSYPPTYLYIFSLINKAKFEKLLKKEPHKKNQYFFFQKSSLFVCATK